MVSAADHQNLRKILNLFANVRSLILKGTGIKDLGLIGEILCERFLKCKRLDFTGHAASKTDIMKFVDILEGRSLTKDVPPFWLALGDAMQELMTPKTNCNPNTGDGCHCHSKRVVHAVACLQEPTPPPALPLRKARNVPPPPKASPPLPPQGIVTVAGDFAAARQRLKTCIEQERVRGRTVMRDGIEYVLMTYQRRFVLVDFTALEKGLVREMEGAWLRLEDTKPAQSDEDGIVTARAGEFCVGADQCSTPESYLRTGGGEPIKFRVGDFTIGGWVAATHSDRYEWKWLPLHKCVVE